MVFRNAPRRLDNATVIPTDVQFLPLYERQPPFSGVEPFLRSAGVMFHCFVQSTSGVVDPLAVEGGTYAGLGQLVWANGIFVKDFPRPGCLCDPQLLARCRVLHEVRPAIHMVPRLLAAYDA